MSALLSIEDLCESIDDAIRNGRFHEAKEIFSRLLRNKLSRGQRLKAAQFSRRLGNPNIGVRLLHSLVRPDKGVLIHPTPQESSEYAACLANIGGRYEARAILTKVNKKDFPYAEFLHALVEMTCWDYKAAASSLESYLARGSHEPYQHRIAKVNLIACYVLQKRTDAAEKLLSSLLSEIRTEGLKLLETNLLELRLQNFVLSRNFSEAELAYKACIKNRQIDESIDSLFLEKWEAVYHLYRDGSTPVAVQKLKYIQSKAIKLKHWETVRDCDYHLAAVTHDDTIVRKLYFGTPYEAYRKRIVEEFGPISGIYIHRFGIKPTRKIYTSNAQVEGIQFMDPRRSPWKLFQALASDLYRPFHLADLFGRVFPNSFYCPLYSPARMHQLFHRLKSAFDDAEIPLKHAYSDEHYQLKHFGEGVNLVYETEERQGTPPELVRSLAHAFGDRLFDIGSAADHLAIHPRTLQRRIKELIPQGWVLKIDAGPKTVYSITSQGTSI